MGEWIRHLPFMVAGLLRTTVRALVGITLVFLSFFLVWFTFEFLVHLKNLLSRTVFGHEW